MQHHAARRLGRRRFMGTALTLSAAACCPTPEPFPFAEAGSDLITNRPIIDAHAHVFNFKDLPAFPFVHECFVERYASLLAEPLMPILKAIVEFVQDEAPGYDEEQGALPQPRPKHRRPRPVDALTNALSKTAHGTVHTARRHHSLLASPRVPSGEEQKRIFVNLRASHPASASLDPDAAARALAEDILSGNPNSRQALRQLFKGDRSNFAQMVEWVCDYSKYRKEMVQDWAAVVGGTGPRFCMEALVDFGLSLDGVNDTDVRIWDQVALMGDLSRALPEGLLLHGYAAFNPVRFMLQADLVRAMMEDAIDNQGFLGAKLYPPMGFQASGNAALSMSEFRVPGRSVTGEAMDQALNWLYDFIAEKDGTILVHTSPSNSPHAYAYDGVGPNLSQANNWTLRPEPKFWRDVLVKRRTLRVNIGHFGGAHDICHNEAWADEVIALMRDFPNVYADFADDDLVLAGTPAETTAKNALADYLARQSDPDRKLLCKRVMFGTDWNLMGRTPNHELYTQKMLGFLRDALGGDPDDFAYRNAMRFAGLDDPDSQASKRLIAFHARHPAGRRTLKAFTEALRPRV